MRPWGDVGGNSVGFGASVFGAGCGGGKDCSVVELDAVGGLACHGCKLEGLIEPQVAPHYKGPY